MLAGKGACGCQVAGLRRQQHQADLSLRKHQRCGPQSRLPSRVPARQDNLPGRTSTHVASAAITRRGAMNAQIKQMRDSMEEDEQLAALMAGLRGSNMDESDFAMKSTKMNLMEVKATEGDDKLPTVYEPQQIAGFWGRRPVSVVRRVLQLAGIAGGFVMRLGLDAVRGRLKETETARAIELREIMTSLGPAYIKLGQALSIRPDVLSPAAMREMQKLCDKVPSFCNEQAMAVLKEELGKSWEEVYEELTPEPIAAASLGQVYKGRLRSTGEAVAVKVQRPGVLETVTVDLFIIRSVGLLTRRFLPSVQERLDIVGLLDEWASRFFEELDYVKEGKNGETFIEHMRVDLPQVMVPRTYAEFTSRRVLTTGWLEGEKLSQSKADDVGSLVNVGVISYLKQLLDTGFFHADPHPGNLIRTPDGRLAILDFGLICEVDDNIKFGMIEAISHLIHRDYEAIVVDFVTLGFIPEGTDLRPILPVLARVFDRALEGGGAKGINFQELAADLAQITFDYPFRIPPYFALIIRAISVLEGIALVGNPEFAIVDEAFPYIARRLVTDPSPRLREALHYMIYGRTSVFDADRFIDLLSALEDFQVSSTSAMGDHGSVRAEGPVRVPFSSSVPASSGSGASENMLALPPGEDSNGGDGNLSLSEVGVPNFSLPLLQPVATSLSFLQPVAMPVLETFPLGRTLNTNLMASVGQDAAIVRGTIGANSSTQREAVRFMLSPEGTWFRQFVMDELVKSIDALSRDQAHLLAQRLGLAGTPLPVLFPGAKRTTLPLAPEVTAEDRALVDNVLKIMDFLSERAVPQVLPELMQRLAFRVLARLVRDLYGEPAQQRTVEIDTVGV
ncbi:ABC1 family-domain-containing protein [Dunaliella salina]|uniref:ABC1 family-domain-containing protein n=1 Tax=Dunaliella salina TaxID=3046 RepID=A0ABQ7G5R8_DUNSA|nr:ABC1 family-domain-containing protein [Dunaliella salina]|eukprot:KAF5829955.1 ABC1 family-domain-containing protein [Dunaliella salina]